MRVVGMDSLSGYCEDGGLLAGLYLPSPSRVDTMSQDQDQMSCINKPSVKPVKTLNLSHLSTEVIEDEQSYEAISDTFMKSDRHCVHTCAAQRSIDDTLPSTDSHLIDTYHSSSANLDIHNIDTYHRCSANLDIHNIDTYHRSSANPDIHNIDTYR